MSLLGDIKRAIFDSWDQVNGGFDVNPQSSTSQLFQYFLIKELKANITLTSAVSVDDMKINVSAGHTFAVDDIIVLRQGDIFEQASVLVVDVNELTINIPVANAFSVADCQVIRGNKNLALDGSTTIEEAYFKFYDNENCSVPIDLSKIEITMTHSSEADDSKFGGITGGLSNPVYFRKINGSVINLGAYKCNQCFRDRGATVVYSPKAGGGKYATNITFNLEKDIFGQVIRLDPSDNDTIGFFNPGDLSPTNLITFSVSLIGSYTSGE